MTYKTPKIQTQTKKAIKRIARSSAVPHAILVGLIAGLLTVAFRVGITEIADLIHNKTGGLLISQRLLILPLIGALGGLIAGILIYKIAPESRGSGIPQVKAFLSGIGEKIRIRSIIIKFFAGIAGIGTGLSLGREGPSVQLGAGSGALISKIFKIKGKGRKELIAAGAGAAIGATFNAPIAATIFVLEELVHGFSSSLLLPVLLATVVASTVARSILGNNFAFQLPQINEPITPESIPVFIILGVLAGVIGVAFTKNVLVNLDLFDKLNLPRWSKPALAGFITGLVGVFLPFVLGPGNFAITELLNAKFAIGLIILIFICKFFLTSFCFGSGAAGGLFLPTLMLGSFAGYLIGIISNSYLGINVDPVVVSLVGMGAFLSAVARTPITAVVIVFEMTGDYNHILPIMLSAAVADLIAEKLHSPSIYSLLLLKRSVELNTSPILNNINENINILSGSQNNLLENQPKTL